MNNAFIEDLSSNNIIYQTQRIAAPLDFKTHYIYQS